MMVAMVRKGIQVFRKAPKLLKQMHDYGKRRRGIRKF